MMKHRVLALVSLPCSVAFAGIIAAACVGDATTTGTDLDGGADATATGQSDGGGGASDGGSTTNDSGGSATCTPGCSTQTTLTACFTDGGSSTTNCAFDCTADGGAHCLALVASPPVLPADLALAGLSAVNITADGFLSTDTGTIDGVRGANPTPMTPDTQQGVRFHVHNGVGIYSMKTLTIAQGVTLKLRGTLPVALVADTIDVKGVIDLRGYDATGVLCIGNVAGPGGFIGGPGTTAGGGPGGGAASGNNNSGGGGANGADGGNGGAAMGQTNYALGGPSVPFQLPIVGGSGGGSCTGNQTKGGGGGGAVQLVGVTEVKIGNAGSTGGLNAGGCGGSSGAFGSAGGGGGSGGTILIESPQVTLHDTCVLAANGGGGGTGNAAAQATNGLFSDLGAAGTQGVSGYGTGGPGGASGTNLGTFLSGSNGSNGNGAAGGAGGGSVGRIHILNGTGKLTPGPGVILSPNLNVGPTTVGKIGLQ